MVFLKKNKVIKFSRIYDTILSFDGLTRIDSIYYYSNIKKTTILKEIKKLPAIYDQLYLFAFVSHFTI